MAQVYAKMVVHVSMLWHAVAPDAPYTARQRGGMKPCKANGCKNRHKAKGYCEKHYVQIRRHGKLFATMQAPRGQTATQRAQWLFENKTIIMKDMSYNGSLCRKWLGSIGRYIPRMDWDGGTVNAAGFFRVHLLGFAQPEGTEVLHKCNIVACVNPHHIRFGSRAENVSDAIFSKTHVSYRVAKLTGSDAQDIYARAWSGEKHMNLAQEFQVSTNTISNIKHGRVWEHSTKHQRRRK